ncbi:MAG TPA: hypothetical protein VGM24_08250, partial [Puia sp.]
MKRIWGIVIGIFIMGGTESQVFHLPVESVCLNGGAYSERFGDALSFSVNPAVLGLVKTTQAALSSERRWMLNELSYFQAAGSFPAGGGGIGIHFHFTGDAGYSESGLALGYGKSLGRISMGLQFRYDVYHLALYGNKP